MAVIHWIAPSSTALQALQQRYTQLEVRGHYCKFLLLLLQRGWVCVVQCHRGATPAESWRLPSRLQAGSGGAGALGGAL